MCISDSEEIANQQDAPCDKLVRVSVSRTGVENQVMLDREIIPFYRLVIGVKDSKCDQEASGSHKCETSGNDILYPKDCVCEVRFPTLNRPKSKLDYSTRSSLET